MYNSGEGFILTLHLNYILFYSYVCSSYKQCLYWYVCAYCSGVFNWYVFASYNGVYIVMFVNLIQYNCCSYLILVTFSYVSPMYGLFFHFIFIKFTFVLIWLWILYLWLLQYVCVIHTILSLVALHLGDIVMHISCLLIVVTLFPSLLTYIHNSGLICFVWISCHMHWSTYLCSCFLNILYIYFHYNFLTFVTQTLWLQTLTLQTLY